MQLIQQIWTVQIQQNCLWWEIFATQWVKVNRDGNIFFSFHWVERNECETKKMVKTQY